VLITSHLPNYASNILVTDKKKIKDIKKTLQNTAPLFAQQETEIRKIVFVGNILGFMYNYQWCHQMKIYNLDVCLNTSFAGLDNSLNSIYSFSLVSVFRNC